jgi:hypothetical protein
MPTEEEYAEQACLPKPNVSRAPPADSTTPYSAHYVVAKSAAIGAADGFHLRSIRTPRADQNVARYIRDFETRKDKCHNRLNWSDGGHWQGIGPDPNCFDRLRLTSGVKWIYEFADDESAFAWNGAWQRVMLRIGHFVTAATTAIVALTTKSFLISTAVGTLAAIFKDEVQARIPYPKVARGWKYIFVWKHMVALDPHPWSTTKEFEQEVTGTVVNLKGEVTYQVVSHLKFNNFPRNLAIELATLPDSEHVIKWRPEG